ncbi:hypothetical protein [Nitrosopumilus sp.]|uniref:hypothetical protein n=1 Tax=Nitrosopumilus sp. TaxID=2024843 RepID=UPI002629FA40|nr:hypothetical protein [Nitrosopumilus sp.]
MNRKTACLIPAFAAVFALMFSFASPLAMAEYSEGMYDKGMGQKHKKMHKVVEIEGFTGSIQVTEDADKQTLKDQVSVSLSEAASGLDVMGGHIGVAVNENDDKFVAWILKSVEKDSESTVATITIHVIDAGDATNTATITKEVDFAEKKANKISDKIDRLEDRFSESSGDADVDAARATFVEKLQELRQAIEDGDSERVTELREELKDLRSELGNIKSFRK